MIYLILYLILFLLPISICVRLLTFYDFMENQQLVLFKNELCRQGFYGMLTTLIDYHEKRS
jgi:hypothetical protein